MSESRTAYHYAIHAIAVKCLLRLVRIGNVTVPDDGDVHTRIVLHLAYERPIGFAAVQLAASTTVNGQSPNADVLQPLGQFDYDFRILVPSQTRLHRYRLLHCIYYRLRNGDQFVRLSHHTGPGSPSRNLRNGAAEVNVYEVRTVPTGYLGRILCHLGRFDHSLGNVSVNLDAHRRLFFEGPHLRYRLLDVANQSIAWHELGIYGSRPLLPAQYTERCICNIFHRCQ